MAFFKSRKLLNHSREELTKRYDYTMDYIVPSIIISSSLDNIINPSSFTLCNATFISVREGRGVVALCTEK